MLVAHRAASLTVALGLLALASQGQAQPAGYPRETVNPYQPVAPQGGYPWQASPPNAPSAHFVSPARSARGEYQAMPVAGGHYRRWTGAPVPGGGASCPPAPSMQPPLPPNQAAPHAAPPGAPPGQPGEEQLQAVPTVDAPAPGAAGLDEEMFTDPRASFDVGQTPTAANFLGDFIGIFVTQGSGSQIPLATEQDIARERTLTRYKVADNASPEPRCRAFYSFNYFQDAFDTSGDVARNFWGAEIAFFRRSASIDIRANVNSFFEFTSPARTDFGNLFTTFKAVIWRSEDVLFSGGMAVGWPTGIFPELVAADNYYLSPFFGYIWAPTSESWFIQGFQQLDFPTQSEDQPLMHTDVGVGLWLYEWGVCSIAPTVELHAYTPFGDPPSGNLANLTYRDVLNMTVGSTLYVTRHFSVASGVGFPLLSQSDYNVEFQLHVNWFF